MADTLLQEFVQKLTEFLGRVPSEDEVMTAIYGTEQEKAEFYRMGKWAPTDNPSV